MQKETVQQVIEEYKQLLLEIKEVKRAALIARYEVLNKYMEVV